MISFSIVALIAVVDGLAKLKVMISMNILKRILATIVGLLAGGGSVALIEGVNSLWHPMPAGLKIEDTVGMGQWIKTLPASAFVVVVVAWLVGAWVGVYVARRLAPDRSAIPGLIVWSLLTLATIVNLITIPHPLWMWPVGVAGCLFFGLVGLLLAAPGEYAVKTSRTIRAPIDTVFKTLASIENFSKAVPGITNIEFLGEQRYGIGTRFRETRIMNGKEAKTELEVTELQENKEIRIVSDTGGAIWDTLFSVDQKPDAVEMHMRMDARPHQLIAKILTPMILGIISKAVESDMDSVKSYCESLPKSP